MAQLLKPSDVKIITKDGELEITLKLEININVNQSDIVVKNLSSDSRSSENKLQSNKDSNVSFEIPDFGPSPKLKFGKQGGNV